MNDPEGRAVLVQMAQTWLELAQQAEQRERQQQQRQVDALE
jgi:hypothetical protein